MLKKTELPRCQKLNIILGTIVENTTEGLEKNVLFYYDLAYSTDVKIVAGTGFYIEDVQAADVMAYSQEDMYKHMSEELTVGYNNIKAGFIGEVASVWPIRGNKFASCTICSEN